MGHRTLSGKGRLLVVLGGILLALGSAFVVLDVRARAEFREVRTVVDRVQAATGALPVREVETGNGLAAYLCVDVECPSFARSFLLAVPARGDREVVLQLLAGNGYAVTVVPAADCGLAGQGDCTAQHQNPVFSLKVTIGTPSEVDPPLSAPSGTVWRSLWITATHH